MTNIVDIYSMQHNDSVHVNCMGQTRQHHSHSYNVKRVSLLGLGNLSNSAFLVALKDLMNCFRLC